MVRVAHLALAVAGTFVLWRAAIRVAQLAPDEATAAAFPLAVLIATLFGSLAALVAGGPLSRGRAAWSPPRALALDAAAFGVAAWWLFVLTLGPWTRELGGVSVVAVAVARLAPATLAVATLRAPSWLAFVVALGGYGALAAWLPAASLPFGDQVHYLLATEQLRQGSLAASLDPELFRSLIGFSPSEADLATHVADTPQGPRPIQGYATPFLLWPGWALAGRLGAHLTMAAVAAWASHQTFLILRDLTLDRAGKAPLPPRAAGVTWILASFLAPLPLLATHLYPNIVGAAIITTAFRVGFTAPVVRPDVAAVLLALTLTLTPRDAVALFVLLPFLLVRRAEGVGGAWPWRWRPDARAALLGVAVIVIAISAASALLYGLPVPYAGYAFGTAQAQTLTQEPSITPRIWIGLPAILFDRTFGLAGTAPWVFIGLLGLVPLLRSERDQRRRPDAADVRPPVLLPAALTVGLSVLALSFFRLWEGGYAPPNRYFVDVLPLWAPFVAFGLVVARGWVVRVLVAVILFASALATIVMSAIPSTALNTAFDHQVRHAIAGIVGSLDPLVWLPSFQPTTSDWVFRAYTLLIPAAAIALALVWTGSRFRADAPAARWIPEMSGPTFLAANAVAIGLVVTSDVLRQAFPEGPVPESLTGKWLPLALGLATAGSYAVSRILPEAERHAFLLRHFFLYLPALGVFLVQYAAGAILVNAQLGAVYLAVAVIFSVNAVAALWRAVGGVTDRAAALQLAGIAFVAFLVLLPYHRAVMPTASDEPHYLLIVQSLIYDGDVDLRNDYEGDRYSAFYPARLPDMHGIEIGAAVYPIRDLGLPIVSALPFAAAGRIGVLVLMCLIGAALVPQLYLLLRDLRFDPRVALAAVATTALAHPILTYTTQVYPELLTALVFVTAARLLRRGAATSARDLALASGLTALLPLLSTRAWPIAIGVGLVIAYAALRPMWDARRIAPARLAGAALPFVVIIGALSFANFLMFGLFLPSAGYYIIREQQQVLAYAPHLGGTGLVLDRVFGLIPRAPVYLLGFVGIAALVRRVRTGHGPELAVLTLGGLLSFAYIANIAYWWADGSPPSRYLLGAIPLFVAAVAGGWEVALAAAGRLGSALRSVAWTAVNASAVIAFIYAMQPNIRYDLALDIRATGSSGSLFAFLDQKIGLDPGQWFPSLVRPDTGSAVLVLAWLALAAGLVWIGRRWVVEPARAD